MCDPLKALGKYGSEKPDGVEALPIGTEGYASAGSTLFYAGPYYTQIVSTKDDAKFSAFARELAGRIAALQTPARPAVAGRSPPRRPAADPRGPLRPAPRRAGPAGAEVRGAGRLRLQLPVRRLHGRLRRGGRSPGRGSSAPTPTRRRPRRSSSKYLEGAKQDGAEIKTIEAEGADRMVVSSNVGLVDVFFLKGNVVGGANGATDAEPRRGVRPSLRQGAAQDRPGARGREIASATGMDRGPG